MSHTFGARFFFNLPRNDHPQMNNHNLGCNVTAQRVGVEGKKKLSRERLTYYCSNSSSSSAIFFFEDAAKVSDLACYYWFMQTDSDQKSYRDSRETAILTRPCLPLVRDRLQALCYVNSFPALKARLEKESRGLQYRPRKRGEKGTN